MKHILTTNEPFLLERGNESIDLTELKVLDWTELPWWLTSDNNEDNCTDDIDLYPEILLGNYIYMSEGISFSGGAAGSSKLNSIYGVQFEDVYEVGYTEDFTSELGKLIYRYIGQRLGMEYTCPLIWDTIHGKVYRIKINMSGNTISSFKIILVADHQYNPDRIYSYPMEFGTKIYFKFHFGAEEIPSYISNSNEMNPAHWLYRLNLVPVYHDSKTYNPNLIGPPYKSLDDIAGDDTDSLTCHFLGTDFYDTTYESHTILTPCIYFNLGIISSNTLKFRGSYYLSGINSIDFKNIPIVGRFTAGIDNLPIIFNGWISDYLTISDSNPAIIQGHTYEYHVMDYVFSLIDITGEMT